MIRKITIALLLSATSLSAHAENAPTDMASFCEHDAARIPFYPTRAQQRNLTGDATLDCTLNGDHTLNACQVIEDTPPGFGFGRSALRLACRWTPQDQQAAAETPYAPGERHVRRTFRFGQGDAPPPERERGSIISP
jgi:hypothetical protein